MTDNLNTGTAEAPIDYTALGNSIISFAEKPKDSNDDSSPANEQISDESDIAEEDSTKEQGLEASEKTRETPKEEVKKYKVKVDQEELEVDEQELLNGYSRQADYSRKTQALAEEKKALEKEKEEVKSRYGQKLEFETDFFEAQLKAEFGNINWQELEQSDREEYLYQARKYDEKKQQLADKKAEIDKIYKERATEQDKLHGERLRQEVEILKKVEPDFADPEKARKLVNDIGNFLKSKDYSDQEINAILNSNHRNILLVKEAMDARALKNVDLKAKKVVVTPSINKSSNFRPKAVNNNLDTITNKAKGGDKKALTALVSAFINA